jgi:hypothetical protein
MRIVGLLAPALVVALAGCSGFYGAPRATEPVAAPEMVAQASEEGGRIIALVGPQQQHDAPFLGVPNTNFYALRSWLDTRSGQATTQLYVEDSYVGGERAYDAARDAQGGRQLRFIPISRNEIACDNGGCSYAEEFAAELPDAVLRAYPQGLTVMFAAKSGPDLTIAVPGELVGEQLAAIDRARAGLPPTTSAAAPR